MYLSNFLLDFRAKNVQNYNNSSIYANFLLFFVFIFCLSRSFLWFLIVLGAKKGACLHDKLLPSN